MALTARGPTLTLRYPHAQDAPGLFELASDPEVTRFFSWGPYVKQDQAAQWLASVPSNRDSGTALEFVIADSSDDPIGVAALIEFSLRDRRCVIGIWLGRPYWGTGAGDEAEAMLARVAFEPLRIERLAAWVDVNNHRSQRAFERLGFTNEGVLRAFMRHHDERRDLVAYSLLREEWERSPLAAVPIEITGEAPAPFVPQ